MRRITEEGELQELASDAGIMTIRPKLAYVAATEGEVSAAMGEAAQLGLSVTPRGGGTSIPSQSVGRGAILVQGRASAEIGEGFVRCEPGLVKADLNRILAPTGRWMPVDPSSYASCTVGGMVANNASGARTMEYGSTIEYVSTLRVARPGERAEGVEPVTLDAAQSADPQTRRAAELLLENQAAIREENPRVTKNSSGYRLERVVHDGLVDLPRLFVGSEGTLGVITEATLTTRERPKWRLLFVVEARLDGLGEAVGRLRSLGPAALELVDKSVFVKTGTLKRISRYSRTEDPFLVFCELDGGGGQDERVERAADEAAGLDPLVVYDPAEIQAAWDARGETLALSHEIRSGTRVPVPGVEDLVVPPDRLSDLVRLLADQFEKRGLEYVLYGHAGDANLHARPLLDPSAPDGARTMAELMDECFESVWKMGGSMTGEHGDGMLRARYVERQYPRTYWIMKEIKGIYDPKGVLNPGVKIA